MKPLTCTAEVHSPRWGYEDRYTLEFSKAGITLAGTSPKRAQARADECGELVSGLTGGD